MLEAFSKFLMRFAKKVLFFSVIVIITYFLGMKLFSMGRQLFYEYSVDSKPGVDIEFTIEKGDTLDDIASNLYDLGLIDNTTIFKFRANSSFSFRYSFKLYQTIVKWYFSFLFNFYIIKISTINTNHIEIVGIGDKRQFGGGCMIEINNLNAKNKI